MLFQVKELMRQWKIYDEFSKSITSEVMHDEQEHHQIQRVVTNVKQQMNRKKNKDKLFFKIQKTIQQKNTVLLKKKKKFV